MIAVVGITAAVVIAAGIGVIIVLNAVEHRRLCAARRKYTATYDQGVNGDTIATLRRWQRDLDAQLDEWEAARKPQAAPWPDGDTIVTDGMTTALNEMLRGDGRD